MNKYDWLLFLHITGAFLLLGGGVVAAALNLAALRASSGRARSLLLFGLIRIAVAAIVVGSVLAFVFGLWLVNEAGYGYGDGWIVAAIVLLILGNAIGGFGGSRDWRTASSRSGCWRRATRRAPELKARVRDPIVAACNYGSGLILVACSRS